MKQETLHASCNKKCSEILDSGNWKLVTNSRLSQKNVYHTVTQATETLSLVVQAASATFREAERWKLLCLLYSLRGVCPGLIHTEVCQDARVVAIADVPETWASMLRCEWSLALFTLRLVIYNATWQSIYCTLPTNPVEYLTKSYWWWCVLNDRPA